MAPIPRTQCGVKLTGKGGVEVLDYRQDLPIPDLKEGEVLIKTEYSGINYIDTYFRTGLYPAPTSGILGQEAEGVIAALAPTGPTHGLQVGQRVVALCSNSSGYSQYTPTAAKNVYPVPDGIAPGASAAALLQGLTALTMIREAYPVKSGEIVLVHAAAGGVGLWLTQLLKAIGARVIATASTEEKLQLAKENGAEFLVNYAKEDWVAKVKEITDGKGVPAIFDGVGASTFEGGLEAIAKKGTFVSFGNASGAVPPFAIARLGGKNIKLMRTRLFPYVDTYEEFTQYTAELLDFVKTGKVNVRIHKTYDLKDVKQAHNDIEGRVTTGKLLLKI